MANVIRDLVIKVTVDANTKGFDDMNRAQDETGTKSVALGGIIADLAGRLIDVGIQAAKAGVAFAKDLVFGQAEAADNIAKTSKQLGVQSDQLQRLSGAAQLSGASLESVDKGVRTLTRGLAAASLTGTGPAAEALGTLGLTVEGLAGQIEAGNIEGLVGTIGDAFNETEDSIERSAALMLLFGKAGTDLRPLLEEGSEGVTALGDEIKNVIGPDELAQFEKLQDQSFLLEDSLAAVKNEIAIGLAPVVGEIIDETRAWISENQEFIQQDLPAILSGVADAMRFVAEVTFETIDSWREFIRDVDNLSERLAMDFPEAVGFARDALELIDQVATDVGDSVERVVTFILDAISKLETLSGTVDKIKAGLGIDQEPRVERGAGAALPGGGPTIVPVSSLTPDNSPENLQNIIDDPNASEADRASAAVSLPLANLREFQETLDAGPTSPSTVQDDADRAAARAERASRRAMTSRMRARDRRRREGGGGGGGARAAEPTLDDLIAGVVGAPGGGPPRAGGGSALADTVLVNNTTDNSVTIGATTIQLEVPSRIAEMGTPEDLAAFIGSEIDARNLQRRQISFDLADARNNVGGG